MQHQAGGNHGIQRDAAAPRHIAQGDDEARRALQEIERHGRRAARFEDARLRAHSLQRHRLPAAQGGEERQAVTGRRHCRAPRGDQDLRRFQLGLLPRAARQGPDAAQPRHQRDLHPDHRQVALRVERGPGDGARGPAPARRDLVPGRRRAPLHERDLRRAGQGAPADVHHRRQPAAGRVHAARDAALRTVFQRTTTTKSVATASAAAARNR